MNIIKSEEMPFTELCEKVSNRILIKRSIGGIGDILYHRFLFKTIKDMSNYHVTFAVPRGYMQLVIDHKYIDDVIPIDQIDLKNYLWVGDTTHRAGNYEYKHMPNVELHRSDIWAHLLGFTLNSHDGYLKLNTYESNNAIKFRNDHIRDNIAIGITAKTSNVYKDWHIDKWNKLCTAIVNEFKNVKIFTFGSNDPKSKNTKFIHTNTLRYWMSVVSEMDVIITPATSLYVLANLFKKPTIAIFGNENLETYGKYFPESVNVQRNKKYNKGWDCCPCWNTVECKYGIVDGTPACLRDISVSEVLMAFRKLFKSRQFKPKKYIPTLK